MIYCENTKTPVTYRSRKKERNVSMPASQKAHILVSLFGDSCHGDGDSEVCDVKIH